MIMMVLELIYHSYIK